MAGANDVPSIVPARWEWDSFDLTKSQKFTGVVKELTWERDKLATAKIDVGGKLYNVMLGLPIRWTSAISQKRTSPRGRR